MSRGKHFLVGGGIAALSAAAFLIRDHGIAGQDIVILEAGQTAGGSLDGTRTPQGAFIVRGARMFDAHYSCTLDLMGSIPSGDRPGETLASDFKAFNTEVPVPNTCIRVTPGGVGQKPDWRMPGRHLRALLRILLRGESRLDGKRISDVMEREFFETDMWLVLSSAFAFQPWHSAAEFRRYMRRFIDHAQDDDHADNILTTRFNQADSFTAPLQYWLEARGVAIRTGAMVDAVTFEDAPGGQRRVSALTVNGSPLPVAAGDRVYFTLGSMTDGARIGPPGEAPPATKGNTPAFDLWTRLAQAAPGFGRPDVFRREEALTGWQSFTLTLPRGRLVGVLDALRPAGAERSVIYVLEGTPWRMSLVPFAQPHFRDQPPGTEVIWGYGLRPDLPGAHCKTTMEQARGTDVIEEIAGHLDMDAGTRARIFDDAAIIACRMPLITSQFMPRCPGDRPQVRPEGAANYALMGQYVEIPFDTVFTIEYSVRSAWEAVHRLNPGGPPPPPVARPDRDPKVLMNVIAHRLRTMI